MQQVELGATLSLDSKLPLANNFAILFPVGDGSPRIVVDERGALNLNGGRFYMDVGVDESENSGKAIASGNSSSITLHQTQYSVTYSPSAQPEVGQVISIGDLSTLNLTQNEMVGYGTVQPSFAETSIYAPATATVVGCGNDGNVFPPQDGPLGYLWDSCGPTPSPTTSPTRSPTTSSTSSGSTTSSTSASSPSEKSLSTGVIVGIAAGSVVGVILL